MHSYRYILVLLILLAQGCYKKQRIYTDNSELNTLHFNVEEDIPLSVKIPFQKPATSRERVVALVVEQADNGTLSLNTTSTDGKEFSGIYNPEPNFYGEDKAKILVTDNDSLNTLLTLKFTVAPVNDPPTAYHASFMMVNGTTLRIPFTQLANDIDTESLLFDFNTSNLVTPTVDAIENTVSLESKGVVGVGSIPFKISDGNSSSNGQLDLQVIAAGSIPPASNITITTQEDTPITTQIFPPNGFHVEFLTEPARGALDVQGTSITYIPNPDENGSDPLEYRFVQNGSETTFSNTAILTVGITPRNDPPHLSPGYFQVAGAEQLELSTLASDPDLDTLTYSIVGSPSQGTVTIAGTKANFDPGATYVGPARFNVRVSDPSKALSADVQMTVDSRGFPTLISTAATGNDRFRRIYVTPTGTSALGVTLTTPLNFCGFTFAAHLWRSLLTDCQGAVYQITSSNNLWIPTRFSTFDVLSGPYGFPTSLWYNQNRIGLVTWKTDSRFIQFEQPPLGTFSATFEYNPSFSVKGWGGSSGVIGGFVYHLGFESNQITHLNRADDLGQLTRINLSRSFVYLGPESHLAGLYTFKGRLFLVYIDYAASLRQLWEITPGVGTATLVKNPIDLP